MNTIKQTKQSNVAHRASLASRARSADATRAARMVLQDEVLARLDQERAMRALGLPKTELRRTNGVPSTFQSVFRTLLDHPVGVGIGMLAAGVAIGRAIQSQA